jgi:hypothetical protein
MNRCKTKVYFFVSAKTTNNEIVKALIVLVQNFFDHNTGKANPGMSREMVYGVIID